MPHESGPHEVIMPALGMAQDTGLIVSWLKNAGDAVKAGDALFEVETDKATMEVEAPADGFLTDVQAEAGAEVPVGNVIALISDTAENTGRVAQAAPAAPSETAEADEDALPDGASIIMPALGMAQDTGLIVAWHKSPGDAVSAGDILFEVETDKSTMEVEAGHDGFVAALLAEAGEEAPVGDTIAIISAGKPAAPAQRSARAAPKSMTPARAEETSAPDAAPQPKPAPAPRTDGRILASPKARRIALEEGLDLSRLVEAGHPQPYHMRDLDTLRALPASAPAPATATASAARHLTAEAGDGFTGFARWAAETAGLTDPAALLAGLAAASLGTDCVVQIERFGQSRGFAATASLGDIAETSETGDSPALILRDMRGTGLKTVQMGAESCPVLTLTETGGSTGAGLAITLECGADQLSASAALALVSNFAGRMGQPLRHLL